MPRERLKKRAEFKAVFERGRSWANRAAVIYVLERGKAGRQVGFSVSKRLGGAVRRNRVRRLFREIYRLNRHRLRDGVDIILIARAGAATMGFHSLAGYLVELMERAGVLLEDKQCRGNS